MPLIIFTMDPSLRWDDKKAAIPIQLYKLTKRFAPCHSKLDLESISTSYNGSQPSLG